MAFEGTYGMAVAGAAELERKLLGLERKVGRKVVRQALRAGAKIVLAAARAGTPTRSGKLRKQTKVRTARGQRPGAYAITVTSGESADVMTAGDAYYGAFLHMGHRVGHRRLGNARRQVPPNPWIDRAFEASKAQAEQAVLSHLAAGIERVAAEGKTT